MSVHSDNYISATLSSRGDKEDLH